MLGLWFCGIFPSFDSCFDNCLQSPVNNHEQENISLLKSWNNPKDSQLTIFMTCKVIFYVKFYRAHSWGQTAQAQAGTLWPGPGCLCSPSSQLDGSTSSRAAVRVAVHDQGYRPCSSSTAGHWLPNWSWLTVPSTIQHPLPDITILHHTALRSCYTGWK